MPGVCCCGELGDGKVGEGSGAKMEANNSITNKTGPGLCLTARKNPSISPDGFIL